MGGGKWLLLPLAFFSCAILAPPTANLGVEGEGSWKGWKGGRGGWATPHLDLVACFDRGPCKRGLTVPFWNIMVLTQCAYPFPFFLSIACSREIEEGREGGRGLNTVSAEGSESKSAVARTYTLTYTYIRIVFSCVKRHTDEILRQVTSYSQAKTCPSPLLFLSFSLYVYVSLSLFPRMVCITQVPKKTRDWEGAPSGGWERWEGGTGVCMYTRPTRFIFFGPGGRERQRGQGRKVRYPRSDCCCCVCQHSGHPSHMRTYVTRVGDTIFSFSVCVSYLCDSTPKTFQVLIRFMRTEEKKVGTTDLEIWRDSALPALFFCFSLVSRS